VNFLELCQRVQLLTRFAEAKVGTSPTTTLNQEGKLREIVEWVDMAYADVQQKHPDWKFRITRGSFALVSGTRSYSLATALGSTFDSLLPFTAEEYFRRYVRIYRTADGIASESPVYFIPYSEWPGSVYDRGSQGTSRPSRFTVTPQGNIEFDPVPDDAYTVVTDFIRNIHRLSTIVSPAVTADANEPIFAEDYHPAIYWRAIHYHGLTREGGDLYQKSEREYQIYLRRMENALLPETTILDSVIRP
jgi:hypothetical protein